MKPIRWRPRKIDAKESPSLPVPRLEIRWHRDTETAATAVYGLVYKHLLGHEMLVTLGATEAVGQPWPSRLKEPLEPFRDGAHMRSDARQLGLRAFVVAGSTAREVIP